jgi:hydrogenase expression/formation protein HypC
MCLGVPGRIVEIRNESEAIIDVWGVMKPVRLEALVDLVKVGDYVIDHAGHAVRVIPPADVAGTLALYEILLCEAGEDPMARDIADDLAACSGLPLPLA